MTFKLIETAELPDIQSQAQLYIHEATQAPILLLVNDDPNKAFVTGFKTPPSDDTGVFHILEHCVLNGSKKYPVKEPFVELIKSSLATFLNAMTGRDFTVYPIASPNQQDFEHLVSVYLDAVYQPLAIQDENIFKQEGWRYQLDDEEAPLVTQGVVYNEMKGALSSPEAMIHRHIMKALYPNSPYACESGGDPQAIPELTYDQFVETYQEYYHPSQSFTLVYGDFDQDKLFEQLAPYYDGHQVKEGVNLVQELPAIEQAVSHHQYSVSANESAEHQDYLSLSWNVGDANDQLMRYSMRVLNYLLFGHNEAPLKKALLEANFAQDVVANFDPSAYWSSYTMLAKYTDHQALPTFQTIVTETLEQLVDEGFSDEVIESALNSVEFTLRAAAASEDQPRGINYGLQALTDWLYDQSPLRSFSFMEDLRQLRKLANSDYFVDLIQEKLLNNPHQVVVILEAVPGLNDEQEAQALAELQDKKAQLSTEEVQALVQATQDFVAWQEIPDSVEDLNRLPQLEKADLTPQVQEVELTVDKIWQRDAFYSAQVFSSGIDHIVWNFAIDDFTEQEIQTLALMSELLGSLPTENYSLATLNPKVHRYTGGISSELVFSQAEDGRLLRHFRMSGRALHQYQTELIDLMHEILTQTKWDEVATMHLAIKQFLTYFRSVIAHSGNQLAISRALSQVHPVGYLRELTEGITSYRYLQQVDEQLTANQADSLLDDMAHVLDKLLNRQRLEVIAIGDELNVETCRNDIEAKFDHLSDYPLGEAQSVALNPRQNEAYLTTQEVNYVGVAANSAEMMDYTGASLLMSSAIRMDYLWNQIRVQGGAYGAGFNQMRMGVIQAFSYRDPNVERTIDVLQGIPEYIANLQLTDEELLKYMIGVFAQFVRPRSLVRQALQSYSWQLHGWTYEQMLALQEEVLELTPTMITEQAEPLRQAMSDLAVVVVGNKTQLEQASDRFDHLEELA